MPECSACRGGGTTRPFDGPLCPVCDGWGRVEEDGRPVGTGDKLMPWPDEMPAEFSIDVKPLPNGDGMLVATCKQMPGMLALGNDLADLLEEVGLTIERTLRRPPS